MVDVGYGGGTPYKHRAKVFVVQEEWCMLLRYENKSYLTIKGCQGPHVVVCQSATSESIARVLQQVCIHPHTPGLSDFQSTCHLIESDECSANLRAEEAMDMLRGQIPSQTRSKLHVLCAGHKTHQACAKNWGAFPDVH